MGDTAQGNEGAEIPLEDQIIAELLDRCKRRQPVGVAYRWLCDYEDSVQEQIADGNLAFTKLSIGGWFEEFAETDIDMLIAFLSGTFPGAKEVLAMDHSRKWVTDLQNKVIEGIRGGEE